jgi:hypothetical protein
VLRRAPAPPVRRPAAPPQRGGRLPLCLRPARAGRHDLRRKPLEVRKATLASILRKSRHGVRLNEHLAHGHRLEAAGLALPIGPLARLVEVQETAGAGSENPDLCQLGAFSPN